MSTREVIKFESSHESRLERKERKHLEKQINKQFREIHKKKRKTESDSDLERFAGPLWGNFEKGGFWCKPQVSLPTHRVTSLRFGVATPFLSEGGISANGAFIGFDLESGGVFCFDPWEFVRDKFISGPSMLTIGLQGTGKSTTNKTIATRLIALGRNIAVVSDPKGEWVRVARAVGGTVIEIGPSKRNKINPLDPGQRPSHVSDKEWDGLVARRRRQTIITILSLLGQGEQLNAFEHTALDMTLTEVFNTVHTPTLVDVMERLLDPPENVLSVTNGHNYGMKLGHMLRRMVVGDLAGMFDGHSTVSLDSETPMIVIDTSDLLGASEEAKAIANACCSAWIDSIVQSGREEFWLIVQEEGWSAMRDAKVVETMDERQRLAGEWGIANMLIMHELKDLDMIGDKDSAVRRQAEGLMSKAQIKIIHKQAHESIDELARTLGLTAREAQIVTNLDKGVALWKIGDRSVLVHTHCTPNELELFKTDARREG